MTNRKLFGKSLRIRVLELLALCGSEGLHAYAIAEKLNVTHGSLYPALARVLAAEEVEVEVDHVLRHGQTSKRYIITSEGLKAARCSYEKKPAPAKRSAHARAGGSRGMRPEPI
ncbi:MAG: helix-turn-helix transcriptional regulator [Actinomycetota bacterium]|nr:helix-turn-helix transcriptional regulator [Actinomycetota bacterium]